MAELKLTGNCLKGSRPLLSFDKTFESMPHWQLTKDMLALVRRRALAGPLLGLPLALFRLSCLALLGRGGGARG